VDSVSVYHDVAAIGRMGVDEAREFLDSPGGRRARGLIAAGLIAAAPIVARHPAVRATRVMRLLGVAGGATLIVKAAEFVRDWEASATAS
jgi:hypothetical protein